MERILWKSHALPNPPNGGLTRWCAGRRASCRRPQKRSSLEALRDRYPEGSARLNEEQQQRLIRFVDYIARDNRGRKVILVSVGSAPAVGPAAVNRKLSVMRSMSPLGVIEQYLVNTPHEFYKVSSVGDMYAPKNASMEVEQRYQNVRIVAAYNEAQLSGS
jgi:hypothetical protein